jgi:HD superfamily phosphohydrolase
MPEPYLPAHPESHRGLTAGTAFPVSTMLRDALYDIIPLSEPELRLIDTQAFLRMERIQQLGFVSRVWPGARHTRFEHSIGVFHLARQAVEHLRARADATWITDEDARTICAAALLHDIGHYPLSHAVEELGDPVVSHEQVGREIVLGPEIAPILRDWWGIDPERVAAIIDPAGRQLPPSDRLLRGILSGPLDVDKLDYLPRDARACSVPYGGVDTSRLIASLIFATPPDEAEPRIAVDAKGVSPLHSLINARQEMFDNVYWHHTNRACMAMLLRAVQDAILSESITAVELTNNDDASLLALMQRFRMPETTRNLANALQRREIHKRAVEIGAQASELYPRLGALFHNPAQRRAVELGMTRRLETLLGSALPDETILIDIPKPERWRTDVWVWFERPPVGFRRLMPWREVVGLGDDDFKRFEEHRRLIRIIAAAPYREAVSRHWEAILLPELGGVI